MTINIITMIVRLWEWTPPTVTGRFETVGLLIGERKASFA
jgi:hypothetical protein